MYEFLFLVSFPAGNSFVNENGRKFTTRDRDHDTHGGANCAVNFKGGWWYKKCHAANINGLYHKGDFAGREEGGTGMNYNTWKGSAYSLAGTELKLRPRRT